MAETEFRDRGHGDWSVVSVAYLLLLMLKLGTEPAHSQLFGQSHVNTPSQEHSSRGPVEVSLDPNEHQDHRWVSEAEIENAGKIGGLQIVTEDQHAVMLEAFQLHNSNRALVEADITSQ